MIKAEWILDYDLYTDKSYKRPGCPDCCAPIGKCDDGEYRCCSCEENASIDKYMKKWLAEREETKVEMEDCIIVKAKSGRTMGCGGKSCVKTLYRRNPVTMEWEVATSHCLNCGQKIIV